MKYKNKYKVSYCGLCKVIIAACPECTGTTCNGHSCTMCHYDLIDFDKEYKPNKFIIKWIMFKWWIRYKSIFKWLSPKYRLGRKVFGP